MLVIGSDHGGFLLKQEIKKHLEENKIEYIDVGCYDESSVDYPDIAKAACDKIVSGECQLGILICGTGIGISMAAQQGQGHPCGLLLGLLQRQIHPPAQRRQRPVLRRQSGRPRPCLHDGGRIFKRPV